MIFENFNRLTPAEDERLAILLEELGEAVQAIGKIQRHGYESDNRGQLGHTNRMHLEMELGHIDNMLAMMVRGGDVRRSEIAAYAGLKRVGVKQWLHHQPEEVL